MRRRRSLIAACGGGAAAGVGLGVALAFATGAQPAAAALQAATDTAAATLTAAQAVVLGLVEGVTEYLPISSTGHLLVASRIMGLPDDGAAGDALKSYEIAIQFGAILAVLVLFRRRLGVMVEGLAGRSAEGRRLLIAIVIAFVPAAVVGLVSEKLIKDVLFGVGPVTAAWIVGGVAVIYLSRRGLVGPQGGRALDAITSRDAMLIGAAQVLALWPGTSRSLVTIVAALLLGLSMEAAVEFSFLLGFVTLGAATAFEIAKDGKTMVDTFGVAIPLLGLAVAFVAALVTIRWMVGYLRRHDLAIFGWYRIAVAAVALVLVATGTI